MLLLFWKDTAAPAVEERRRGGWVPEYEDQPRRDRERGRREDIRAALVEARDGKKKDRPKALKRALEAAREAERQAQANAAFTVHLAALRQALEQQAMLRAAQIRIGDIEALIGRLVEAERLAMEEEVMIVMALAL